MKEYYHIPNNREKKLKAKRGVFWCTKCDKSLVGQLGKCKICGSVPLRRKIKDKE